jgi:hypothetical protein
MEALLGAVTTTSKEKGVSWYQLTPCFFWCPEPESNQRHVDFQSTALPTELSGRNRINFIVEAAEGVKGKFLLFSENRRGADAVRSACFQLNFGSFQPLIPEVSRRIHFSIWAQGLTTLIHIVSLCTLNKNSMYL